MSATLIGMLLDCSLAAVYWARPKPIMFDPGKLGLHETTGPISVNPRSVARALLVSALRNDMEELITPASEAFGSDATYAEICRSFHKDDTRLHLPDDFALVPDIVLMPERSQLQVIEIGYGFVEKDARDALDRLLTLMWVSRHGQSKRSVELVAYVFAHEMSFGESIHETERRFVDWIDANYGPFNGIDRIGLPMRVRLTRTATMSPQDGTVLSAIELTSRPKGFAAFAISCERDRN